MSWDTLLPFLLVPLAGFAGSFHCVAMCGPFVAWYSTASKGKTGLAHVTYHLGRLTAYVGIGVLAGSLGHGVMFMGETIGAQKLVAVLMGCGLVGFGIYGLLPQGRKGFAPKLKITSVLYRLAGGQSGVAAAALVGLGTGLLPCGFLYAFALGAGATAHPLSAVVTMTGFWLGTMPALLSMGLLTRYCETRWLSNLSRLTPVLLIIFGVLAIWGKWQMFVPVGSGPVCP